MKKAYVAIVLLSLMLAAPAGADPDQTQAGGAVGGDSPYDAPMPEFSTPVTHEEIRLAFYRYSVVSIVKALHQNSAANWNMILGKVAEGDEKWIHTLTAYIAPGTDAGATTGVIVSMAHALPNNPRAVLYLDGNAVGPSLYKICTLPFIEPEYAFIKDYGAKTLAALRRVDDPYLTDSRDVCARRLQKSLDYCEKLHKDGKWGQ